MAPKEQGNNNDNEEPSHCWETPDVNAAGTTVPLSSYDSSCRSSAVVDDDEDEEMGTRRRLDDSRQKENRGNDETEDPSDSECTIQQKDEQRKPHNDSTPTTTSVNNHEHIVPDVLYKAWTDAHWVFQVAATVIGCFWTYALTHDVNDDDLHYWDPQLAIMVILVLTGVACPQLFAPTGVGVFAGAVPVEIVPTFSALVVLAVVAALIWRIMAFTKFLAGFGGRMGTTTFIAMNLTAMCFLIPLNHMQEDPKWSRYYGQANWNGLSWQRAAVFVASVTFLSVTGASLRLRARQAVHPFLTPCAVALACDLMVAATPVMNHHYLAPTAYVGFSVGSYVAMAALSMPCTRNEVDFLLAGLAAGLWGCFLQPFFVGFGGKAGFTAFLGFSTYKFILHPIRMYLSSSSLRCKQPKQQQQHDS